ncbi:hypothetical protein D9619_011408 [Psilocybe cf. subviscida]|uniref:Uncharacterized protein n=1 Tax=Psilocybe cf. subviscida TaxID=2480587 RepID=A0A8H5BIW9_9AGAR|nr:hypothetical protein D9619_010610 [Psilocybe cf. subviscida]KAF5324244.1 hypothetical protein D9619_011408 [Psilocybe cf. subviscida]
MRIGYLIGVTGQVCTATPKKAISHRDPGPALLPSLPSSNSILCNLSSALRQPANHRAELQDPYNIYTPNIAAFLQPKVLVPFTDQEDKFIFCLNNLDGPSWLLNASPRSPLPVSCPPLRPSFSSASPSSCSTSSVTSPPSPLASSRCAFMNATSHSHRIVPAIDTSASAATFDVFPQSSFAPARMAHSPWHPRQICSVMAAKPGAFRDGSEEESNRDP